jgi:hypothetical protein
MVHLAFFKPAKAALYTEEPRARHIAYNTLQIDHINNKIERVNHDRTDKESVMMVPMMVPQFWQSC